MYTIHKDEEIRAVFSKCRETKAISLPNHADDPVNQSKLTASTRSRQIARGNLCKRVTISSGLICDWLRK